MAERNKQEQEQEQLQKKNNKRKKRDMYIYGNYKYYYGYRIGDSKKEDPRLVFFKMEWFKDKDCLDIGCNQGLITIGLAKKFLCRSIIGVDIDAGLVESANWNLKRIAKVERARCQTLKDSDRELSNGGHEVSSLSSEAVNSSNILPPFTEYNLLDRVSFRTENIVDSSHTCSEKYDTVLCLSVTKWVHLNWGDEGLITLFAKIWRLLRWGGILVLEPQPWASYKKKHRVSETALFNFREIMLKPDLFQEILLDKIGFRSVENVTNSLPGSTVGFDRPIFVFHK